MLLHMNNNNYSTCSCCTRSKDYSTSPKMVLPDLNCTPPGQEEEDVNMQDENVNMQDEEPAQVEAGGILHVN